MSICCLTYNHAAYVRDCLDGFLMQETDFPVEILIHDDASTDATADIICEYAARYPDLIKPICQKENQYSRGIRPNTAFNLPRAKGKYIAICEGDDYWTAPRKLQLQVEFLEAHAEFSACFHDVIKKSDDEPAQESLYVGKTAREVVRLSDILRVNCIPTAAVMFRSDVIANLPPWYSPMPIGDWPLHVLNAERGPIAYLPDVLGVYRVHGGGMWTSASAAGRLKLNILLAKTYNKHLRFRYADVIEPMLAAWNFELAKLLVRNGSRAEFLSCLFLAAKGQDNTVPRRELLKLLALRISPALHDRLLMLWHGARQLFRRR